MTRKLVVLIVVLTLLFVAVAPAMAMGMPDAHGVDGRTFGAVVSELAQTDPMALVEHVTGCFAP